nr:MAG TPA: hypothetical protein [Caudoviricetes sp.]
MGMFLRRGPAPRRTRMSDLEIGQPIKLNLNGTPWDWLVVQQGLPPSFYDESCNGTWLLLKDIYENHVWDSGNINKYESSDIYTYLNNPFLNLFDSNIKDAIKQVRIPYRKNGGSGGTDQSGVNGLLCKVFTLSGREVGFTTIDNRYFPYDGAKLSYFESGTGTSANNKRIAKLNGSPGLWGLRSPYASVTSSVWNVYSDGSYSHGEASDSSGVRPAIILPSDMLTTDDMLAA